MVLAVRAWRLREAAREALRMGDFVRAHRLAGEAQGLRGTGEGRALGLLVAWLGGGVGLE